MNALGLSNLNLYSSIGLSGKNKAYTPQQTVLPEKNNFTADKVTISEQGKALSNQEVPEELLRMAMAPGWYIDYMPISSKLGTPETREVGYFARVETYKEQFKNELSEYWTTFSKAYESSKEEFGINTQNDMYEKVIKNPENSESIRQTVEQKIAANPRALELMNILGIKRK
ncbi:MAG: hypothetical protein AAGC78_06295 [Cellvibrio sp.]|uniref:hypothetical protein n=1 Tax=Cellvibrio sp. TaxID=1965322 RepID=UPI0031A92ADF